MGTRAQKVNDLLKRHWRQFQAAGAVWANRVGRAPVPVFGRRLAVGLRSLRYGRDASWGLGDAEVLVEPTTARLGAAVDCEDLALHAAAAFAQGSNPEALGMVWAPSVELARHVYLAVRYQGKVFYFDAVSDRKFTQMPRFKGVVSWW